MDSAKQWQFESLYLPNPKIIIANFLNPCFFLHTFVAVLSGGIWQHFLTNFPKTCCFRVHQFHQFHRSTQHVTNREPPGWCLTKASGPGQRIRPKVVWKPKKWGHVEVQVIFWGNFWQVNQVKTHLTQTLGVFFFAAKQTTDDNVVFQKEVWSTTKKKKQTWTKFHFLRDFIWEDFLAPVKGVEMLRLFHQPANPPSKTKAGRQRSQFRTEGDFVGGLHFLWGFCWDQMFYVRFLLVSSNQNITRIRNHTGFLVDSHHSWEKKGLFLHKFSIFVLKYQIYLILSLKTFVATGPKSSVLFELIWTFLSK